MFTHRAMKVVTKLLQIIIIFLHLEGRHGWAESYTAAAASFENQTIGTTSVETAQPLTCSSPATAFDIITAVVLVLIMSCAVAGNSLICICNLLVQAMSKNPSNTLVCSLAACDLLTSILVLPFHIHVNFYNQLFCHLTVETCWLFAMADVAFTVLSVFHLLLICLDRFIATIFPHKYKTLVTKKRLVIVISTVWVFVGLSSCGLLSFNWSNPSQPGINFSPDVPVCIQNNDPFFTTVYIGVFLMPFTCMVIMYTFVIYRIWLQAAHIQAINPSSGRNQIEISSTRERKATISIILVFVAFVICWVPNIAVAISGKVSPQYWQSLYYNNNIIFKAVSFTCIKFLPPLSICLNPVIYGLFNARYRKAYKEVLLKMQCNLLQQTRI